MARFLVPRRKIVIRRQGTLETLLPEGHLARFIWTALASFDFAEIESRYSSVQGGPGRPPYHPRVIAALWIYGMSQGFETAASISEACTMRDDFRWLAGGLAPSDQTLLNFLKLPQEALSSAWLQVLTVMHEEGHVDLSAIAEDGTKLRANASPRSFHTAQEIDRIIAKLKKRIEEKLKEIAESGDAKQQRKAEAQLRGLRLRVSRAEQAARELEERARKRSQGRSGNQENVETSPTPADAASRSEQRDPKFGREDFRHEPERNVMICPAGQDLRFIGEYATDSGKGSYRLYGCTNCFHCSLKAKCTSGKVRRLKVLLPTNTSEPPRPGASNEDQSESTKSNATKEKRKPGNPKASVTEPECVMMLATSEKRWEPSYNADITVTRHGVIVSQFLTKNPTDFHHFAPALDAVLSTLGRPETWVGDGHYGTYANLLLADREGVVLYAPSTRSAKGGDSQSQTEKIPNEDGMERLSPGRFSLLDFRHEPQRDVMICPANEELRRIGVYRKETGLGTYRLYGRTDCRECDLKARCTKGNGRRLKVPNMANDAPLVAAATESEKKLREVVEAHEARMEKVGSDPVKFRSKTVEPTHAHLKQHGVGRFHVRGKDSCAAVLTLACIAHNLTKWKTREDARALIPAA